MRRFCFALIWLIAALMVAGFLEGIVIFFLALAGLNLHESVLVSALYWVFAAGLFIGALILCIRGQLPGTEPRQRS